MVLAANSAKFLNHSRKFARFAAEGFGLPIFEEPLTYKPAD